MSPPRRGPSGRERTEKSLQDQPLAWVVLLAVYIVLGVMVKSVVLNWIVGPLFPLLVFYVVPRLLGRAR
jgi:hypothetical protein